MTPRKIFLTINTSNIEHKKRASDNDLFKQYLKIWPNSQGCRYLLFLIHFVVIVWYRIIVTIRENPLFAASNIHRSVLLTQ
jgi:hypothetical protein